MYKASIGVLPYTVLLLHILDMPQDTNNGAEEMFHLKCRQLQLQFYFVPGRQVVLQQGIENKNKHWQHIKGEEGCP